MEPETPGASTASRVPRPINDQVLIRTDPPKDRVGSGLLFAPQGSEVYPSVGTVIAVGPGGYDKSGNRVPLEIVAGDRVLFKRKPSSALNRDVREGVVEEWRDLVMLRESDVAGVVTEE